MQNDYKLAFQIMNGAKVEIRVMLYLYSLLILISVPSWAASKQKSCAIGNVATGYVSAIRENVFMYSAPNIKSKRVINDKATRVLGQKVFRDLGPGYQLRALCQSDKWIYAQIFQIDDRLEDAESGWIQRKDTGSITSVVPVRVGPAKTFEQCVTKGVRYFKTIKMWPRLDNGYDANDQVQERCGRTIGAFDGSQN